MDRRAFIVGGIFALATPLAVEAQQASRVRRIGFLRIDRPPAAWIDGFLLGLREQQYVEGKNFVIEYGLARDAAELPEIAATLVRSKVDVLVASGTPSVLPAKNATKTIPVVFVAAVDPVAAGVTASLSHPGGNVTGVTAMHADLIAKRLGLLKDVSPRVSRVTVLTRATSPATAQYVKESQLAAQTLGIRLHVIRVSDPVEIEGALKAIPDGGALMVADDAVLTAYRTQIGTLALKKRLATVYGFSDMVDAGGLMSYGPHYGDMYRRAALQVAKILRGTKAGDLPIEQPLKFEFVINAKTARTLGLTIPPSLLARADQVIE